VEVVPSSWVEVVPSSWAVVVEAVVLSRPLVGVAEVGVEVSSPYRTPYADN